MSYLRVSWARAVSPALNLLLPPCSPSPPAPCQLGPSAATVCQPALLETGFGYCVPPPPAFPAASLQWLCVQGAACLAGVSFSSTTSRSPVLLMKVLKNLHTMAHRNQNLDDSMGGTVSVLGLDRMNLCPPITHQEASFPVTRPCYGF